MTVPRDLFIQFIEQGLQKGLLPKDITRTLDGEYYLDPTFIQQTIVKHIEKEGKVTIEKLAKLLNIEQYVVAQVVEKSPDKTWTRVDDLIVTQSFISNTTKHVQKELNKAGSLSIVSLSQSMKLPYNVLKLTLSAVQGYVQYPQLPDIIMTKDYVERGKVRVEERLSAIEEPCALFKVQKSLDIPEDIFYLWVEQVIKEKSLGIIRGKRSQRLFEPKDYKKRQINLLKSIFDSNGFISFDTVENLYIFNNAVDLVKDNYDPNSYYVLHSCIIKTHIKDSAKDALQSMTDYCDVNDVLPNTLTLEDVNKVIDLCVQELASTRKIIILEGGYVTTPEYIQSLIEECQHYLYSLAQRQKQKDHKGQARNNKHRLQEPAIIKALEAINCPYHLAEKILPLVRKPLNDRFDEMMQTPYTAQIKMDGDSWVVKQKSREYQTLVSMRSSIYFNYKAICLFEDEAARKSLEKYLLKNQCTEFLYHFVLYIILDQSYSRAEVEQSTSLCISTEDITKQSITDIKQQRSVIAYFIRENDHKYDKTGVLEMEGLLKKKKLASFIDLFLLQDQQRLFQGSPSIDKEHATRQTNKMVYEQLYKQLEQTIISEETAPQILHLVSLLLFLKYHQLPLYVSGKFVPIILNQLEHKLTEEEQALVDRAHASILL
ncbi:hypothetical protein G6F70_003820 [Rhizopus microsporus]|nr:hypothetical protein G6F71_006721 [Rhizopus microsporus]KAG1200708.1 hypothetical protein G6F70_003820 [Rhizopus microsporus]KAG1212457.1 hypothetical protein G6F69_003684 [Rhizopus microsporus]KAG1231070.1 hypothetical protein G6F67_006024 [Rhizopus microsporus]KAG1266823.1 hypothetical protein G6F68_002428 [Rhizopus microsporus]